MEITLLFLKPENLIFTVPMITSVLIWLLSFTGLFETGLSETDIDTDIQGFSANFLDFLGVGSIPLSLVLTMIMFSFGWLGLFFNTIISNITESVSANLIILISSVLSLTGSFIFSSLMAKPLKKVFKNYGESSKAETIIGKTALLNSSKVNDSFGIAVVHLESGVSVEIDVRSNSDLSNLKIGDQVVVVDFDKEKNIYYVEALNHPDLSSI